MAYDAPLIVKHSLKDKHKLQQAYIGTTQTEQQMEALMASPVAPRILYTPQNSYFSSSSKYDQNAKSTRVDTLNPNTRFFSASASESERNSLQSQKADLEQQIQDIQNAIHAIDGSIKEKEQELVSQKREQEQIT
eukprot:gene16510-19604_t